MKSFITSGPGLQLKNCEVSHSIPFRDIPVLYIFNILASICS